MEKVGRDKTGAFVGSRRRRFHLLISISRCCSDTTPVADIENFGIVLKPVTSLVKGGDPRYGRVQFSYQFRYLASFLVT